MICRMEKNSCFKIDKGIPIPRSHIHQPNSFVNTLKAMKIGDSVQVSKRTHPNWIGAAHRHGMKVTSRTMSDTEVRIWRIK